MLLILHNPLPLISLNFLGLGFDLVYGIDYDYDKEKGVASLTLCINFIFGQYLKTWILKRD